MTPTWYDLLGVDPDATPDEIRAAWKAGIADLEPGDRRFRSLNEAAEVLLDPERRAAYDATLEPEGDSETELAETTASLEARPPTHEEVESRTTGRQKRDARRATEPEQDSRARRPIPAWLLAAVAVLVALLLACAGYLFTQPSDDDIATATSQAQGQAERAATTILAYDYRHLKADQAAAQELMTASYQKKYDALFTQIAANAPQVKAVVTVQVVASGIVRSGDDRVQVLVFVNRPTLRADTTQPVVYRDQVVMTMVKQDGDWLVDDLDTNQLAG